MAWWEMTMTDHELNIQLIIKYAKMALYAQKIGKKNRYIGLVIEELNNAYQNE